MLNRDSENSAHQGFVINLCVVPAPITIPQPRASRLTRFSFFLSHCWEDGRRQFQLQMGYFPTVSEAEKWLATLRKVYPMAYVSAARDTQPDLMSNTQTLKVLQLGQIDDVSIGAELGVETRLHGGHNVQPRKAPPVRAEGVRKSRSLADPALEATLEALRTSGFEMDSNDDVNSTGVRHLRFEVQKQRK